MLSQSLIACLAIAGFGLFMVGYGLGCRRANGRARAAVTDLHSSPDNVERRARRAF